MNNFKTIKCPICDKRYLIHALSKHIVQQGQREVYKVYKKRGYVALGSDEKPHEDFVKQNTKNYKKFKMN